MADNKPETFSAIFKEILARDGWDARDAKDHIDISRAWIYELMRGTEEPSADVLLKVMRAFPSDARRLFLASRYATLLPLLLEGAGTDGLVPFLLPEHVDYLQAEAERRETTPGAVLREAVETYAERKPDEEARGRRPRGDS